MAIKLATNQVDKLNDSKFYICLFLVYGTLYIYMNMGKNMHHKSKLSDLTLDIDMIYVLVRGISHLEDGYRACSCNMRLTVQINTSH